MMSPRPGYRAGPREAAASADPALDLLRGGAVPALSGGVLVLSVAAFAGTAALAGAAVGMVLASAAMAVGPLLMHVTRRWTPPAVMAVALTAYGAVVIALGVAFVALQPLAGVSAGHLAAALIVCGAGWTVGELRAASRLRTLAFGDLGPAVDTLSAGGDDGS
jgi:hypothetical protein